MKNYIYLLKILIIAVWISLAVWNAMMSLADSGHHIPQLHKEILAGIFLFWFVTTLFDTNIKDDDWAGDF